MSKPILNYNLRNAFDSKFDREFEFVYDGNQCFSNRLIVKNNSTNEVVYNQLQDTLQLKHVLPRNTLSNGVQYNARIVAIDANGVSSEESDTILFYCFTTPTFGLNIANNDVVRSSNKEFVIAYSQQEGEVLQNFQIILSDMSKQKL